MTPRPTLYVMRLCESRDSNLRLPIVGAAKRGAALTHRLSAFRVGRPFDPEPVSVDRLIAGMEDLVRRSAESTITVEVVAAGGLWTTLIDPGQRQSPLLNLCIKRRRRDACPSESFLSR
jgi:hypothetical protein